MSIRVITLTGIEWGLDDEPPVVRIPAPIRGGWGSPVKVDPHPAYMHDASLVRSTARKVEATFPIGVPCEIAIIAFEALKRTNGECDIATVYEKGKESKKWAASIRLWGKRIPPHPAMTRYLVSHEYGHAVAGWLVRDRGGEHTNELYDEYRALRRGVGRAPSHYGAGTWHAQTSELFANDFRILVTGSERDFWPHAGFSRPEDSPKVRAYWRDALARRRKAAA